MAEHKHAWGTDHKYNEVVCVAGPWDTKRDTWGCRATPESVIAALEAREAALTAVVEAARPLRLIRGPMPLTPQTRELFGNLWAALDALDGEGSE